MKALVLAAGRGSRLGPRTDESNKCMLELFGKPLLEYSLQNAVRAGVSEIVVVVGYLAEQVINRFGINYEGTRIQYVIQDDAAGLVHAIQTARPAIGRSDFMLFLADEVLDTPRHPEMLKTFEEGHLFGICGIVREKNAAEIRKTYTVIADEESRRIYRLIEKPRHALNNIRGTGNCIFKNAIFDYVALTPINQNRQEKELPDLIQCAVDDGEDVRYFNIGEGYININTPDDIGVAERHSGEINE